MPTAAGDADHLVCETFWGGSTPLFLALGLAVLGAGAGFALSAAGRESLLPSAAGLVAVGAVVVVGVLVARGYRAANALCRYQRREIAAKLAANAATEQAKAKAVQNQQALVAEAAKVVSGEKKDSPLSQAQAQTILADFQKKAADALASVAKRVQEAQRTGKKPDEVVAAPPPTGSAGQTGVQPDGGLEGPVVDTGSLPPDLKKQLQNDPGGAPVPPPIKPVDPNARSEGGLPEGTAEVAALACMAAGVSVLACAVGTAILSQLIQPKQGEPITNPGKIKDAATTIMKVFAAANDPSVPPVFTPEEQSFVQQHADQLKDGIEKLKQQGDTQAGVLAKVVEDVASAATTAPRIARAMIDCFNKLLARSQADAKNWKTNLSKTCSAAQSVDDLVSASIIRCLAAMIARGEMASDIEARQKQWAADPNLCTLSEGRQ